jgi:7-keto-8-aminopelargonate synthetase-like enzyme
VNRKRVYAASGLGYENVAESHGAEVFGPYGAGMHEGELPATMTAFALDLHTTITTGSFGRSLGMMVSADLGANPGIW